MASLAGYFLLRPSPSALTLWGPDSIITVSGSNLSQFETSRRLGSMSQIRETPFSKPRRILRFCDLKKALYGL